MRDLTKYITLSYLELEDILIFCGSNIILRDELISLHCNKIPNNTELIQKGYLQSVSYYLQYKPFIFSITQIEEVDLAVQCDKLEIYKLLLDNNFTISINSYEYMLQHNKKSFLDYICEPAREKLNFIMNFLNSSIFKE